MIKQKNSSQSLLIISIAGIISITSLLFLFSNANLTGEVYGGPIADGNFPYLEKRTLRGIDATPEGITVYDEDTAYAKGIPFRSYSRVPENVPSMYTACGDTYLDASLKIKKDVESLVDNEYCEYYPDLQVFCCFIPLLKTRDYANFVPAHTIH